MFKIDIKNTLTKNLSSKSWFLAFSIIQHCRHYHHKVVLFEAPEFISICFMDASASCKQFSVQNKKIILMRINFSFIVGRIFLIRILNRTWMNFFLILSQSDDIKFCVNIQFFLISFVLFWFGNIAQKFKKKNLRMDECKRTLEGHFCCDFFFSHFKRGFFVFMRRSVGG